MANKRIFWACTAIGIATDNSTLPTTPISKSPVFVPGVQSVGISTTFNLEQVFELGQLEIYQDVEEVPDVEITVERVLDEHQALYQRVMSRPTDGSPDRTAHGTTIKISENQNNRCDVIFEVHDDNKDNIGDSINDAAPGDGKSPRQCWIWCSGMYASSASFNMATDGNFTESITLVGNHKKWYSNSLDSNAMTGSPTQDDLHTGSIARRQNLYLSSVPASFNPSSGGTNPPELAVNSISISTDFGREKINVLGKRLPYHRYVTFPVEVTCDIEVTITDAISQDIDADPNKDNLSEESIVVVVTGTPVEDIDSAGGASAVHTFDLGSKNKVTSVTYGGADTGGANATMSFSYRNFNRLNYTYGGSTLHD